MLLLYCHAFRTSGPAMIQNLPYTEHGMPEKDRITYLSAEKDYFDQRKAYKAPVRWLKYTTVNMTMLKFNVCRCCKHPISLFNQKIYGQFSGRSHSSPGLFT